MVLSMVRLGLTLLGESSPGRERSPTPTRPRAHAPTAPTAIGSCIELELPPRGRSQPCARRMRGCGLQIVVSRWRLGERGVCSGRAAGVVGRSGCTLSMEASPLAIFI